MSDTLRIEFLRIETFRSGAWRVRGARELFEALRAELEEAQVAERRVGGPREPRASGPDPSDPAAPGSPALYLKGSPLRLRPALRHGLRRAAGLALPRLAEFENLLWLRAHGFAAARPLVAGVYLGAGLPRYQFLATELVPGAATLEQRLPGAPAQERAAWLTALARDLAALHRLGFVHRDLFLRNLLVGSADATGSMAPRCVFLDAWRGGARRGSRGPDHDLGCLLLEGASVFTRAEQSLFLGTYRAESLRLGRVLPGNWARRVERARAGMFARESRRHPGLARAWSFPPLHL